MRCFIDIGFDRRSVAEVTRAFRPRSSSRKRLSYAKWLLIDLAFGLFATLQSFERGLKARVTLRSRGVAILPSALLLIAWMMLVTGCGKKPPAPREDVSLGLYFTCDISGKLVPCNCFSGQLGGMTRLDTFLSSESPERTLRFDVGDAIQGTEEHHVLEYRYLLDAFKRMHFDAINLGHREAQLPKAVLAEALAAAPLPVVSSNLCDETTEEPLFPAYVSLDYFGYNLAVVGALSESISEVGAGLMVKPMVTTLKQVIPALRKEHDLVVLLAFADRKELRQLADEFYEVDIVLGGNVSQPSQELETRNRSVILYTTNESRSVGFLKFGLSESRGLEVKKHHIGLLTEHIPQSRRIIELSHQYQDKLRHTPLAIDNPETTQGDVIPGVAQFTSQYVDSATCQECHPTAYRQWKASLHSHAWETLVARNSDADPECIRCHTVGFGKASGYRRGFEGQKLVDVGCESCHGPGSRHVEKHRYGLDIAAEFKPVGEGTCRSCHYGEFSRPFDWDTFWPLVQHGHESSYDSKSLEAILEKKEKVKYD